MAEDNVDLMTDGDPVKGEKEILSDDEVRIFRSLLVNLSNDSDNDISAEISPDELSDKSGGYGPFSVTNRPGEEGKDDKIVVGPNSQNIDTFTKENDNTTSPRTVPRSVGRSRATPGILHTLKGSYYFTEENVVDLWDFDNHPYGDNPKGYQTATLFLDLRNWNGEQAITSGFYTWGAAPYNNISLTYSIYNTVGDLIESQRSLIIPLAHIVVHRDTDYSSGSDIPNKVYHIYSFWSEPEIDRTNVNLSAVPVKITGDAGNGEYYVDIHANGKHNNKTAEGTLEVYNINISETLPNDTWLSADYSSLQVTG